MLNGFGQDTRDRESSYTSENRHVLWIETGVVLFLIMAPTLNWIVCWSFWGSDFLQLNKQIRHLEFETPTTFAIGMMEEIFIKLRWLPVVLFIIWRSGYEWSRFGLVKPKLEKDILIGFGLFLIVGVMNEMRWVIGTPSHHWTWSVLFLAPISIDRAILLLASSIAIGFSEEIIARGYLIPRFEVLIGSTWKSILISAILFGFMHIHKSLGGAMMSCLSGIIWGIGFCVTRRIWPVAISHAMLDFVIATHMG
jgi:membrane protease YdiL (CAAX protease family)